MLTERKLAEIAAADAEIERDFRITQEEILASRERDKKAKLANADNQELRAKEYQRAYYEAKKDAIKAYQRAYRGANKDAIKERNRAYREANKDAIKEYQRAYYEANKDAIKERRKRKNALCPNCGADMREAKA